MCDSSLRLHLKGNLHNPSCFGGYQIILIKIYEDGVTPQKGDTFDLKLLTQKGSS